jgi:quinoprotein glucose dehydrogenase
VVVIKTTQKVVAKAKGKNRAANDEVNLICSRNIRISTHFPRLTTITTSALFALFTCCISHAAEIVKISASSAQQENPAPAAFDNLPATRWATEGSGEWLATTFSAAIEINSVEIGFHHGTRRYNFDLEVSNDGDSWENLGSFTSSGKSDNPETFRFKASSARGFRLISKGSNENKWINIHSLRIPGIKVSAKLLKASPPPATSPGPAGLVMSEVVPYGTVGSCVGISVANNGNIYLSETTRRNNGALDIRRNRGWLEDTLASNSVEDKRVLIRSRKKDWQSLFKFKEKIIRLPADNYSRREVFFEGLNTEVHGLAGGVLWHDGAAYVACIPGFYKITDTDGDQLGDRVEEIAHGFGIHIGYGGHDMHGPTLGPDGRIYWSIGDKGISATRKEDGRRFHFPGEGGVMRIEPDGSGFEVFARGLRNPQELAFDEFGNLFTVDNDGDFGDQERFVFIVEGSDSGWRANHQYRGKEHNQWLVEKLWKPAEEGQPAFLLPPISNYSAGPAGFAYNPGTALGERHRRHFFLAQSNKQITAFATEPSGAGFRMVGEHQVHKGLFIIGINFGPDGALYGADWGNNPWAPHMNGRVIKLDDPALAGSPSRIATSSLLAMDFSSAKSRALRNFITHPDQRIRLKAQFEFAKRSETGELLDIAKNSKSQMARIHALWGYGQLARKRPSLVANISALLADPDPEIRSQAAKVIGDSGNRTLGAQVVKLLSDESPRVRMSAGIALHNVGNPGQLDAVCAMLRANDGKDRVLRHAGIMALSGIHDSGIAPQSAEPKASKESFLVKIATDPSAELRRSAVVVLRNHHDPHVARYLNDPDQRVATDAARAIHDDLSIPEALPDLARTLGVDRNADEAYLRRAISANIRVGNSECAIRLAAYAADERSPEAMRTEAIKTLSQWTKPDRLDRVQGWHRGLEPRNALEAHAALDLHLGSLLASGSKAIQSATATLIKLLDYGNATERVTALALNTKEDAAVRASSLIAMAALKAPGLTDAINLGLESDSPRLRMVAREAILNPAARIKQIQWASRAGTLIEKQHAIALAGRTKDKQGGALMSSWLNTLARGKAPAELALDIYIAASKHSVTSETAKQFAATLPAERGGVLSLALHGGDPEKGEEVFRASITGQCVRCHRVGNRDLTGIAAAEVGPELTGVGSRRDREYLLRALVNPSADIDPDQLREGQPANISVMPPMAGLLKPTEIRNLVAYLASLK